MGFKLCTDLFLLVNYILKILITETFSFIFIYIFILYRVFICVKPDSHLVSFLFCQKILPLIFLEAQVCW